MSQAFKNKRIWITGASSGIGYACALAFAAQGAAKLVISGRNIKQLESLKAKLSCQQVLILPFDVTSRIENKQAAESIVSAFGGVDIVFLNAGASEHFTVRHFDSAVFERMIAVNYLSLVYGIEASLPMLRQSRAPQLIGMSSLAGYGGLPNAGSYCAAKAAARVLLESLKIDLLPEKISVSMVCPGFVSTPLTDKNRFRMPFILCPKKAARIILHGIERKKAEIHFPKRLSILLKLLNCLPKNFYTYCLSKIKS